MRPLLLSALLLSFLAAPPALAQGFGMILPRLTYPGPSAPPDCRTTAELPGCAETDGQ